MTQQKTAKRYSFSQLLSGDSFNIEIPIIQRDFAQGRESQQEVRTNFLGALYKYLEEEIPNRDLDFIYGYITDTKNFIPLDGQQRLTTLFLLHWYLATANNDEQFIKTVLLNDGKSKFLYKTRFSSTDFCEALLTNDISLNNLKEADKNKKNSLSKTITNKGWFQKYWITDATVLSMLNMLDDIHYLFRDKHHFYNGLIKEQPIITFLFLNLEDLKQGDDLYIKMNSRGKPLTNFENFKARFEQEIKELFTGSFKDYSIEMGGKTIECTIQQYFSYKIDCVWTDLLWNYRSLVGDVNTYDEELMNFIRASLTLSYVKVSRYDKTVIDQLLSSQDLSFNRMKEVGLFTIDSVNLLISSLNTLMNGSAKSSNKVSDVFYFDFTTVFENILKNTASIAERVLYYAYINFLITHPGQHDGLQDWMRVIANLIENTRFDSQDQFYSAIQSISKLTGIAPTILEDLTTGLKIDFFNADQVYEERIKAKAILSDRGLSDSWENTIVRAEKAIFHKGQIGYLFEFSNINNVLELEQNLGVAKSIFNSYLLKSTNLFSILEGSRNEEHLLERALLTFGNYLIEASNWRFNFSSSKKVANYDRDYSWKRILRVDFSNNDRNSKGKSKRLVFKSLVDSNSFNVTGDMPVEKSLNLIISQSDINDWRKDFISDHRIISSCVQGYIYDWEEDHQSIQVLNASQMNHLRTDLNLLVLSYQIEDSELFGPFTDFIVYPAKGYDDDTKIILSGWCYNRIHYKIEIEYFEGKYFLIVAKGKGENKQDQYGSDLKNMLNQLGYVWEDYGFVIITSSRITVLKRYKELLNELNQLAIS